jgi:hypothetical protein
MEGWDPIKQCNPATCLCLSQAKTWISYAICHVMKKKIYGNQFHQYQQSPLILTELNKHKNDHDIRRWKSRSWFGTGTKCGFPKPVNGIPTLSSLDLQW